MHRWLPEGNALREHSTQPLWHHHQGQMTACRDT